MKLTANHVAALISLYFLTLGILYSASTPPFEGPDELAHFIYIHNIVKDRQLPVIPDKDTAFDTRNYEVHQLPLYYIAATPLISLFERDDLTDYFRQNPFASIGSVTGNNHNIQLHPIDQTGDTHRALWAVRLLSLSLGIGTLWCVYHSGSLVWDERTGLAAMFLAASIPTFIHISASANNDNLNAVLSSVVVVMALRAWTQRKLTLLNAGLAGAALAGAAITKLTGLAAYGFVVGMALIGGFTRRFAWGRIFRYFGVIAGIGAILAGWWYVRSVMIYGDPLAYDAARALWGREVATPSGFELWGVWESFWMTLGHLNLPGPAWLTPYVSGAALLALTGVFVQMIRVPESRWRLLFLLAVALTVTGTMIYVTRRMNISQGRALFPAMAAITPLLVIGWRALLGKHLFALPAIPIAFVAVTAPWTALRPAFAPLEVVATSSTDAAEIVPVSRVDARAESITVLGYNLQSVTVGPDGDIKLDVTFQGNHPENPTLFVTARHPITGDRLGSIDTYPGMAPTDILDPDTTYRAPIWFQLTEPLEAQPPFQVQLALGWRVPDEDDPGEGRHLSWFDGDDNPIGAVFLGGPILVHPDYAAPPIVNPLDVTFGDQIRLHGYEIIQEDDATRIRLWWERTAPITEDWTLTVGIADSNGDLVAQQDAPPTAYPTSAWSETGIFTTDTSLPLTLDGDSLRLGWYLPDDGIRLVANAGNGVEVRDNLVWVKMR
jgi:hypothetical protein